MKRLLVSVFPAVFKLCVEAGEMKRIPRSVLGAACVLLLCKSQRFGASLIHAERSLFLTSWLPKLRSTFVEYRSKGPSVLPVRLGNKQQRPFKRRKSLQM